MHHGRKTKNAKCTAKHKYFPDLVCNDAVTASFVRYPPYRDRTQGCSWHFGKGEKGRAVWHSDGKGRGAIFVDRRRLSLRGEKGFNNGEVKCPTYVVFCVVG